MSTEKLKKSDAGEVFLASLTSGARAALERMAAGRLARPLPPEDVDDEAEAAGAAFLSTLTAGARAALTRPVDRSTPERAADVAADRAPAKYAVVEFTEGEWPQLRVFKNAEGAARRIGQLEGTDTFVIPVYGIPLGVSKGPQRYMTLPGGKQLIQIPMYAGGPAAVVEVEDAGKVAMEEAGYVGPPELISAMPDKETAPATAGGDEDDD